MSKENLYQILSLSEKIFTNILKNNTRSNTYDKELLRRCKELNFSEVLVFLLGYLELLLPLAFDDYRLMIGFNDGEI